LPLEELAGQAAEWGYQGLELCCWGDHLEVQRALGEEDYCPDKLALLGRLELTVPVLNSSRVSQAVCNGAGPTRSSAERRASGEVGQRDLVPDYVWGDGQPEGVRQRAAEEMLATAKAAQKLGVGVLSGLTGSPLWAYVACYPPPATEVVEEGLRAFARQWHPILDACQECGLRYAGTVGPGQVAFDLYSAERTLDALGGREEFGFTLDPAHLHWQGVDPVEFVRRFPERIYHVHVTDAVVTLNGRSGLLGSYLPEGDPRRGWQPRAPGRGGVDWEALIRALNEAGYDGPLAVDWRDPGMDRAHGAAEACQFVGRLNFEPPAPAGGQAFR
jgi:sugar phosphate isomerase/epimerase